MVGRDYFGPVFENADLFDVGQHAELLEHGKGMWKERFPDVKAGMAVFFKDLDIPAPFRQ